MLKHNLRDYELFGERLGGILEELNERIDDHMIQEDMNKKTINELNESNKKLIEKIKFYQDQKENNKKKDNKVADYLNNGLIAGIESLEELGFWSDKGNGERYR